MNKKTIFTIGRQFGSGGHTIGELLAKRLDIPFYDNELIDAAMQKSGIHDELFRKFDEKVPSALFHPMWSMPFRGGETPIGQQIFFAQFRAIEDIAKAGPAVIVGRCADYALRARNDVVSVFLHAKMANRVKRVVLRKGIPDDMAAKDIQRADKARAAYYNFFTEKKWGDAASYDICLATDDLTPDQAVDIICQFAEMRG